MKAFAVRMLIKAAKFMGMKTALRMGWKYLIHPKLKAWTESNQYPEWDEKILKWVNDNIYRAINAL